MNTFIHSLLRHVLAWRGRPTPPPAVGPRQAVRTGWPPLPLRPQARRRSTDKRPWAASGPPDEWNRITSAEEASHPWHGASRP